MGRRVGVVEEVGVWAVPGVGFDGEGVGGVGGAFVVAVNLGMIVSFYILRTMLLDLVI